MRADVVEQKEEVGSSSAPSPVLARDTHILANAGTAPLTAQMLSLQRTAGNRAVGALLGRGPRAVARCPGCGGTCGEEELVDEEGQRRLGQAALARRLVGRTSGQLSA